MYYSVYGHVNDGQEPDYVHTFDELNDALDVLTDWANYNIDGARYVLETHTDPNKYINSGR